MARTIRSGLASDTRRARPLSFGAFSLDPDRGVLLRNGDPVAVGRRGIRLLEVLVGRDGETVGKTELFDAGWPGLAVEESNLSVQIALLRRAIGRAPDGRDWIETVPRVGYRFQGGGRAANAGHAGPALVVLPFASIGHDEDLRVFAEGLTEELITTATKVSGFKIAARRASGASRTLPIDVRRLAADLDARFAVAGSVRRDGTTVRVAVEVVDGATGSQLWAERYQRAFGDAFALQDDLARCIVAELVGMLGPSDATLWPATPTHGTSSVEAFRRFQRGRVMQRSPMRTPAMHARSCELFRQAVVLDAGYAAPYAALAMGAAHAWAYGWEDGPGASLDEATRLADAAIALDPRDPYVRGVAAMVAMYATDVERWSFELREALALDGNFAPALALRAALRLCEGDPAAAIDDMRRAIRLDPHFTHHYLHDLGVAYLLAGQYEAAVSELRERLLLVRDADASRAFLAAALGHLGRVEEARQVWRDLLGLRPGFAFDDRISTLPFRRRDDLDRIRQGLERAGLPASFARLDRDAPPPKASGG